MLDLGKLGRWWSGGAALLLLVAIGLTGGALTAFLLLSAASILLGGGSVLWLMLYSAPIWAPLSIGYMFAVLPRPLVRDVLTAGTIS